MNFRRSSLDIKTRVQKAKSGMKHTRVQVQFAHTTRRTAWHDSKSSRQSRPPSCYLPSLQNGHIVATALLQSRHWWNHWGHPDLALCDDVHRLCAGQTYRISCSIVAAQMSGNVGYSAQPAIPSQGCCVKTNSS